MISLLSLVLLIVAVAAAFGLGWLLRPRPPVTSHFVRAWKPMTPEQWAAAFRAWPDTDPRWRATWDLLSHHLEAELAGMESTAPDPNAIVQASGRLQMLLFLRAQLLNLRRTES